MVVWMKTTSTRRILLPIRPEPDTVVLGNLTYRRVKTSPTLYQTEEVLLVYDSTVKYKMPRWTFTRCSHYEPLFKLFEQVLAEQQSPCHATIPGGGFAEVSFCSLPKGHKGMCRS